METITAAETLAIPYTNRSQDTLPELDLMVTDDTAILSYKKQNLIKFSARIRIAPEELVDYVNRGVLSCMTEVGRISQTTGLKVTCKCEREARQHTFTTNSEPLTRLLLQQKWYTLYFVTEEYPFTGTASGDAGVPTGIPEQLSSLFSPGNALVDYIKYRIFLKSLVPCLW